eukprot:gene13253-biopygen9083
MNDAQTRSDTLRHAPTRSDKIQHAQTRSMNDTPTCAAPGPVNTLKHAQTRSNGRSAQPCQRPRRRGVEQRRTRPRIRPRLSKAAAVAQHRWSRDWSESEASGGGKVGRGYPTLILRVGSEGGGQAFRGEGQWDPPHRRSLAQLGRQC